MTWPWAKPADAEETKATMDALDKVVNPSSVATAKRPILLNVKCFCGVSGGKAEPMTFDKSTGQPGKPARWLCPQCGTIIQTTIEHDGVNK